jgi:hypothetical protein
MKNQSRSLRIGLITLVIITLHVSVALYLFFAPKKYQPQNRITSLYRQLVLLGPFFTESRINYSPYFSIRYKAQAHWSAVRELGTESFSSYLDQPWQVKHLAYIVYEKQLADELASINKDGSWEKLQRSSAFREFNGFVLGEIIQSPADSINVVYALRYLNRKEDAATLDTVFNITYSPLSIGKAKK